MMRAVSCDGLAAGGLACRRGVVIVTVRTARFGADPRREGSGAAASGRDRPRRSSGFGRPQEYVGGRTAVTRRDRQLLPGPLPW